MTSPNSSFPSRPLDWRLISNYLEVFQKYACHDGKEGLSIQDINYFGKVDSKRYAEISSEFQKLPQEQLEHAESQNKNLSYQEKFLAYFNVVCRPEFHLGLGGKLFQMPWAKMISMESYPEVLPRALNYLTRSLIIGLPGPLSTESQLSLKNGLVDYFRENGVHLSISAINSRIDHFKFRKHAKPIKVFGYEIVFGGSSCVKKFVSRVTVEKNAPMV